MSGHDPTDTDDMLTGARFRDGVYSELHSEKRQDTPPDGAGAGVAGSLSVLSLANAWPLARESNRFGIREDGPGLSKPRSKARRMVGELLPQCSCRHPPVFVHLVRARNRVGARHAAQNVVDFVLDQPVLEHCPVVKAANHSQCTRKAQFLVKATLRPANDGFARSWMTATGVRPQTRRMVFAQRPAL